ncbi:hypothetical protein [Halomonas heilongjiangensis]|uniref:Lipoprotein n=1 Tax=Halomonas heilongjiangensis TaxID=1387883 RepID=A0A2N7TJA7_9GAMM|nr:hypothetical protein [Halomonas heilongjiangensis]PMR68276.1 hypothetical protein C1H66_15720 [Halomonas heilongjiangensis]PXX93126.1 hypothetical protein CR158_05430 [Halomonas heilongjiangensis]
MRIRIFLFVMAAIAISACATSKEVYLADGSKGHSISCDGAVQNFGSCLEKAGELCGARGYVVLNQNGEAVPFSTASGGYTASSLAASGGFQAQSGTIITRRIFVKCK